MPYPLALDIFVRCESANEMEDFGDLCLNDFILAHKKTVHQKLVHLTLSPFQWELLKCRSLHTMEDIEEYHPILETAIGYSSAVGTMVLDEVATINSEVHIE